jgi:uncharacterized protein (TIGR00299 family) protein
MKILYFDCFSGIAGDMALGALIDAGLDVDILSRELKKLRIKGYELKASKVMRNALSGTKFDVIVKHSPSQARSHRSLVEILKLIDDSSLKSVVKESAKKIFNAIGAAESKIHGINGKKSLHLHELGDTDSIIDIVGLAIAIDALCIDEIYSSPVSFGRTILNTKGGVLPAPSPASLEILKGAPVRISGVDSELVTPTGAGILKALSKGFGDMPQMKVSDIGYGAGTKSLSGIPNMLRVIIGETAAAFEKDKALVIETNIDDMNPQNFEYLFEKLLKEGALDAYTTVVQMKKSRPAFKLTVLSDRPKLEKLCSIIFSETTSIGIRYYEVDRFKLPRRMVKVGTRYGDIKVKLSKGPDDILTVSPEYEDCARLARSKKVPLKRVYEEAKHEARHCERPKGAKPFGKSSGLRPEQSRRTKQSKMAYILLIVAAFLSLATGYAAADTIYTNEGKEIKGIVVEDYKDRIVLSTADGELTMMKSEVRELYYDTEEQNLIKLAEQARDKMDIVKAFACYDKAFKINPDSKQAKDGIVLLQGYLFKKDAARKEEAVNRRNDYERYGAMGGIVKSDEEMLNNDIEKLRTTAGIIFTSAAGITKFDSVAVGSPAYEAGIRKGDTLSAIWGKLVGYMSLREVVGEILKKASFETRCTIERGVDVRISENRNILSNTNDLIGAALNMQFDGLTISSVKDYGPASEAGLKQGDIIVAINGDSTRYMPLKRAIELIKRSKGDAVNLIVRREIVMWAKEGR